ncbi:MAG: hypothetical protein U0Z44_15500 [Kouleothrix sp.]
MATVWHAGHAEHQDDRGVQVHRLKGPFTSVPWFRSDPQRRFHLPFPIRASPGAVALIKLRPDVVHASGWIAHSCAAALLGQSIPLVAGARPRLYSRDSRVCARRPDLHGPRRASAWNAPHASLARRKYGGARRGGGGPPAAEAQATRLPASAPASTQPSSASFWAGIGRVLPVIGQVIADIVTPTGAWRSRRMRQTTYPRHAVAGLSRSFCSLGALRPLKGLDMLLAAYRQLQAPPPLVLIGTTWPDTPRDLPPGTVLLENMPHRSDGASGGAACLGSHLSLLPESLAGAGEGMEISGKAMIATNGWRHPGHDLPRKPPARWSSRTTPVRWLAMRRLIDDAGLRERLGQAVATRRRCSLAAKAITAQFEQFTGA